MIREIYDVVKLIPEEFKDNFIKSAVLVVNKCDEIVTYKKLGDLLRKLIDKYQKIFDEQKNDTSKELLECFELVLPFMDSILKSDK